VRTLDEENLEKFFDFPNFFLALWSYGKANGNGHIAQIGGA